MIKEYTLKQRKKIIGNLLTQIVDSRKEKKGELPICLSIPSVIGEDDQHEMRKKDRKREANLISALFELLLPVESQITRNAIVTIYSSGNVTQELYRIADKLQIGTTKLQKDIDNALLYEADFSVLDEYGLESIV